MKRILIITITTLCLLFVLWFQINIINEYPLFGTVSNIGLIFVIGLGILCGKVTGIAVGTSYGLLADIVFGKTVGLYTALYLIIGIISGSMSRHFSKDNRMSITMMVLFITIGFEICAYIISAILYNYEFNVIAMLFIIFKEAIYNVLVSIFLYKGIVWLSDIINKGNNKYYLLNLYK